MWRTRTRWSSRVGDSGAPVDADTFAATDQDSASASITYSVTGDDREVFAFDNDDVLGFKSGHEPNFEEKSSYLISVVARSGGRSTALDVIVEVVDAEDPERWRCPRGSRRSASRYMPRPATPTAA